MEEDDIRFEIGSPPKSCLELLRVLRDLERFVIAKIDWRASWPPVNRSTPGRINFPVVRYVGQTQTFNEKLLAEHQARCDEFSTLHDILSTLFDAVDLRCPNIPSFDSTPCELHADKIPENVHQARDDAYRFWIELASDVQVEVFNRKELIPTWIPQCPPAWSDNETSSNEKVYPPFPIRSVVDLEEWLNDWIQRYSLPESQKPSLISRARHRSEPVIITVPTERPPFQRPVEEKPGRCGFDDISREHRNCYRTLVWLGIRDFPTWENEAQSFLIAEDRLIAMTAWLRTYTKQKTVEELPTNRKDNEQKAERNNISDLEFVFRRDGDGYEINGFGEKGHISATDAKGLHVIHRLINTPGTPITSFELELDHEAVPESQKLRADGHSKQQIGDEKTFRDIETAAKQLQSDIDTAESDLERNELKKQLNELLSYVASMKGRGGKPVDLNDPHGKRGNRVYKQIQSACKKLAKTHPLTAQHIQRSCRQTSKGTALVYEPTGSTPSWKTD